MSPIPRSVFDSVVVFGDIIALLESLESRKMQRDMAKSGSFLKSSYTHEIHPSLKSVGKHNCVLMKIIMNNFVPTVVTTIAGK